MAAIGAWVWEKVGKWMALLGALATAIFAALEYGKHEGKQQQADADAAKSAKQQVQQAQAVTDAAKTRSEVDNETAKLPDAGTQRIGDAKPGTAAGELQSWTRD